MNSDCFVLAAYLKAVVSATHLSITVNPLGADVWQDPCLWLDCGRKPEFWEELGTSHGKHANCTCTQNKGNAAGTVVHIQTDWTTNKHAVCVTFKHLLPFFALRLNLVSKYLSLIVLDFAENPTYPWHIQVDGQKNFQSFFSVSSKMTEYFTSF